jgi:hypothetical protein
MTCTNVNGWCPAEENDDSDPNPETASNEYEDNEDDSCQHPELTDKAEILAVASGKALGPSRPALITPGNFFEHLSIPV